MKKERRGKLTTSILSLSLLTVMAGAAVAPALSVIQEYFYDTDKALVQMIISVPALFIAITNLVFPKLAKYFRSRELVMSGLALYVVGGCCAGLFSNIYVVLIFRALVGVGVGIIMPMSTGLISFYYTRDKQDKLMGLSSAMNQMGGVIATLISGFLAGISWRASFLVYLMGLLCVFLCLKYLPNEKIVNNEAPEKITTAKAGIGVNAASIDKADSAHKSVFGEYYSFIIAMFLLMLTFFVYPSNFAIETAKDGIIPMTAVSVIMASMDMVAFIGGLSFVHIKKAIGIKTKYIAPAMFTLGYALLAFVGGWVGTITGSVLIGFANGLGIPMIIATASRKAGKSAATTVLPLISMALYAAQFLTPFILSVVEKLFASHSGMHVPYIAAVVSGALLLGWSVTIRDSEKAKDSVIQEN